jgi:hypothetical protein
MWVSTAILTIILVVLGSLNEAVEKFKTRHQHTQETFLDGMQAYVGRLITQLGAISPGQVHQTFFGRLETCHYGWDFRCQEIERRPRTRLGILTTSPSITMDPALLACLSVP